MSKLVRCAACKKEIGEGTIEKVLCISCLSAVDDERAKVLMLLNESFDKKQQSWFKTIRVDDLDKLTMKKMLSVGIKLNLSMSTKQKLLFAKFGELDCKLKEIVE